MQRIVSENPDFPEFSETILRTVLPVIMWRSLLCQISQNLPRVKFARVGAMGGGVFCSAVLCAGPANRCKFPVS